MNRNQTIVAESAKPVATFKAIARNPHKNAVNEARSIPLSFGLCESNGDQFQILANVRKREFEEFSCD